MISLLRAFSLTFRRLLATVRRDDHARELDDEMRFHRDMLTRDFEAEGLAPADAAAAAQRQFGNALALRERASDAARLPLVDDFVHDVRFGFRLLGRTPLFAFVAIVAIGLAIGINTGFLTIVDTFVWQPIPVPRSSEIVKLALTLSKPGNGIVFSYPQIQTLTRQANTLADVLPLARCTAVAFRASATETATPAKPICISGNYFRSLGASASVGRVLMADDERADVAPMIVLSDRFWTRQFARTPDVVGRDVVINGVHATVVGVIRESFVGLLPLTPDFWMTIPVAYRLGATPGRLDDETNRFIDLRARLKPGVTMAQATAEVSGLLAEHDAPSNLNGNANRIIGATVTPNESMLPMTWQTALIVAPALIVVVLVLVIACANLANLMLSRALARQREIAVRLSLGASRSRLLRQLLTESLVIASLGAVLGFIVGRWTVLLVSRAYFARIPASFGAIALDLQPSWRVVTYAVALGIGSVLVFGLTPALYATSGNLVASLKGDDSSFGTRVRRSRFRDTLVAVQVAGCFVLLVAAGTLAASIRDMGQRVSGFRPDRVTVATLGLTAVGHVSPALERARATFATRASQVVGVDGTARALFAPYSSWYPALSVAAVNDASYRRMQYNAITPGYFDVLGQRITHGRAFAADDSASEAHVAIVTETAAHVLWPTAPALDQTLRVARSNQPDDLYRIVGVAADAHAGMVWDNDDDGYVFVPATSHDFAMYDMPLLARSEGPAPPLQRSLLDIGRQIDPNAPLDVSAAVDGRSMMLTPVNYAAWMTSAVGMFGLGLALIGLYGVVAFAVAQRRHEIAVHSAMGALPADVLRLVLRRELRLVFVGLVAGVVMAIGEAALIQAWVLPLTPLGVSGFALLAVMLLVVATTAAVVPATSALRIAPMEVLRRD